MAVIIRVAPGSYGTSHYNKRRREGISTCSVDQCNRAGYAQGLCRRHYSQQLDEQSAPCITRGCDQPCVSDGLCETHYRQRGDALSCSVGDCDERRKLNGFCAAHFAEWREETRGRATSIVAIGRTIRRGYAAPINGADQSLASFKVTAPVTDSILDLATAPRLTD